MLVSEFDYELPPELIAQQPAAQRGASRLLYLDAASGELKDLAFSDLPGLAGPEDLLVLNDTKVIRARLYGRKSTGGRIEVFVERIEGTAAAIETPIGHAPTIESLDIEGLGLTRDELEQALNVDHDEWAAELPLIEEWFNKVGDKMPTVLWTELDGLKSRLGK